MKLENYILREAALNDDKKIIIDIFASHFTDVYWHPHQEWLLIKTLWVPADIRIKSTSGCYSWDRGKFIRDPRNYIHGFKIYVNIGFLN